jgi:hypothetical protein
MDPEERLKSLATKGCLGLNAAITFLGDGLESEFRAATVPLGVIAGFGEMTPSVTFGETGVAFVAWSCIPATDVLFFGLLQWFSRTMTPTRKMKPVRTTLRAPSDQPADLNQWTDPGFSFAKRALR